jgi:hypothetical protein
MGHSEIFQNLINDHHVDQIVICGYYILYQLTGYIVYIYTYIYPITVSYYIP